MGTEVFDTVEFQKHVSRNDLVVQSVDFTVADVIFSAGQLTYKLKNHTNKMYL